MERSELVAEALGEHVFEWFLRNKRAEWPDYKTQVTPVRARPVPRRGSRSTAPHAWNRSSSSPTRCPPELAQALDLAGYPWKAVADERAAAAAEPDDGWAGAIVVRRRATRRAPSRCAGRCASATARSSRCCCSSPAPSSATSSCATTSSTTSASHPFHPRELEARLKHLFWRTGRGTRPELVEYGELRAQPRDLPGGHRRQAARPHLHGVRAAEVPGRRTPARCSPARRCSSGCGATSTTAAPAPSTSTSGACGPSSARSTPTSSRPCARRLPLRPVPLGRLTAHRGQI